VLERLITRKQSRVCVIGRSSARLRRRATALSWRRKSFSPKGDGAEGGGFGAIPYSTETGRKSFLEGANGLEIVVEKSGVVGEVIQNVWPPIREQGLSIIKAVGED